MEGSGGVWRVISSRGFTPRLCCSPTPPDPSTSMTSLGKSGERSVDIRDVLKAHRDFAEAFGENGVFSIVDRNNY